ncbi:MAG: hypothetical protein K2Y22_10935 [Candidatus Obscuribacterales bacterium]|nr:hypothetical protein [Candidatus Obscuribacterales bacterium]
MIRNNLNSKLRIVIAGLLGIFFLAGILYLSPIVRLSVAIDQDIKQTMNLQNTHPIPFDRKMWLESGSGTKLYSKSIRQKMLNDLFTHYKLVGMTRQQLDELLGPGTGKWKPALEISYPLGSFGFFDDMWLAFEIKKGIVTKYIVTPD